jgi:acyl-CoA synthetase (AMP-forming)/AMP-acid ligase II
MTYMVNGKAVGNDPASIERNDSYLEFFYRIGDSPENIKVVQNFITKEEIDYLLNNIETRPSITFVSQKDHDGNALTHMTKYNGILDTYRIVERCIEAISDAYGIAKEKIQVKQDTLSVVKWTEGTYLDLHVDDLGYVTDNHLPVHIYLNDNYEGGEIKFATHDLSFKPNVGEFIVFPGNMHYPHEVTKVLSGVRYTLPIWFTIV